MPFYHKLGEIPRKHHIWFHRNGAAPTFKNEGIAYEHVITTEGFNEAYSIMYHLRPPTRVRNVKLLKCEELKKAADSPLRHHHLRTASIPRRGDLYSGRVPILFNQDMTAWRARPEKPYGKFEYYKNGGADEIIRSADLAMVYGGQHVVDKYANDPAVMVNGPGRTKILITADEDWRDHIDLVVDSIAHLGGMACVNATAVLYEGDPAPLAHAIAERLAAIQPLPSEDERAILPTQPLEKAETLAKYLAVKAAGTTPLLGADQVMAPVGHGLEGWQTRNGTRPSNAQRHTQLKRHEREGFRPDRVAMWAVFLGIVLLLFWVMNRLVPLDRVFGG